MRFYKGFCKPKWFICTLLTDRNEHVAAKADSSLSNRRASSSRSLATGLSVDSRIESGPCWCIVILTLSLIILQEVILLTEELIANKVEAAVPSGSGGLHFDSRGSDSPAPQWAVGDKCMAVYNDDEQWVQAGPQNRLNPCRPEFMLANFIAFAFSVISL